MSFIHEYDVKAVRKRHHCEVCGKGIEIGAPAVRWAGLTDGEFGHVIFHPECREAEVAFNANAGGNWGEWYSLREDREAEDNDWLAAEFPIVAQRLGIPLAIADTHPKDGDATGGQNAERP